MVRQFDYKLKMKTANITILKEWSARVESARFWMNFQSNTKSRKICWLPFERHRNIEFAQFLFLLSNRLPHNIFSCRSWAVAIFSGYANKRFFLNFIHFFLLWLCPILDTWTKDFLYRKHHFNELIQIDSGPKEIY